MSTDEVTGLSVEASYRFAAGPEEVWALLTDVERMAGLGPEHEHARWTTRADPARVSVGDVFVGRNRIGEREWELPCTILAADAPRHLAWAVLSVEEPSSTWTYDLTPDGDGDAPGTVVVQRFRHGPGFSYLRAAVEARPERAEEILAGRARTLRTNMGATLAAAAQLLA